MSDKYVDKPVSLICFKEDKIELNPEAVEILKSIPGPISVLGIAGNYRTGKSFLLNRIILNRQDGFGVGQTINPCTKGIWMWGRPLKGTTTAGQLVNIVVFDSEGLQAIDVEANHDSRIFSLVVLLCSMFIFNQVGPIDEGALENLSFIVNITKSIQLKSEGDSDEDFELLADYMPHFMWILRDFSLELEDQDGEKITSKQYLEKALQEQKGFSDQVERKNAIRVLIKAFFKNRDCVTLVRPVIDEQQLRELNQISYEEMRPEFSERAIELRKHILSSAKVKNFEGQEISGEIFVHLASQYIQAMNSNTIPSILTTWEYISNQQSQKAVLEGMEYFQLQVKEYVENNWPLSYENLGIITKECQEAARKHFYGIAIGDQKSDYFQELNKKMAEYQHWLSQKNEMDFQSLIQDSMESYYSEKIAPLLQKNQYKHYVDYEKDMKEFYQHFIEMDPQGPNKQLLMLDFILQKTNQGTYQIIDSLKEAEKKTQNELEDKLAEHVSSLKKLTNEREDLRLDLEDLKKTFSNEREQLKKTIELLQKQSQDVLEEVKEATRQQLEEKDDEISDINGLLKQTVQQIEELKQSLQHKQEEVKMIGSEFEKDQALLQQRLLFQEDQIRRLEEQEKERVIEFESVKDDLQSQIALLKQENEFLSSAKQREKSELEEYVKDLQEELQNQKQERENEAQQNFETIQSLTQAQEKKSSEYEQLSKYMEELKGGMDKDQQEQLRTELEESRKQAEELRVAKRSEEQKRKQNDTQNQKELAILLQKNDFLTQQCNTLEEQLKEARQLQDEALRAMEESQVNQQSGLAQQMEVLKEQYQQDIKNMKQSHKEQRELMQRESDQLKEKILIFSSDTSNLEKQCKAEIAEMQGKLEESEKERKVLKKGLEKMRIEQDELLLVTEQKSQSTIKQLQTEIEAMKSNQKEISKRHLSDQQLQLNNLRALYEEDQKKQEFLIKQLQEKLRNKDKVFEQEKDQLTQEMKEDHELEMQDLSDEITRVKIQYQSQQQNLEEKLKARELELEELKKSQEQVSRENEKLKALQEEMTTAHRSQKEEERARVQSEMEELKREKAELKNENWKTTQSLERINQQFNQIKKHYQEKQDTLNEELKSIKEEKKNLQEGFNALNEKLVSQKIQYEKEIALSKQSSLFSEKKNEDFQRQYKELQGKHLQQLEDQRQTFKDQIITLKTKLQDQFQQLTQKHEQKKLAQKQQEQKLFDKISRQEQEIIQLRNAMSSTNEMKNSHKIDFENQRGSLERENKELKGKLQREFQEKNQELENLKDQLCNMEIKCDKAETELDKERALWDGKFHFQEDQLKRLQQELKDSKRNQDFIMSKLKKYKKNSSEEEGQAYSLKVDQLHQTHQAELGAAHEQLMAEQNKFREQEHLWNQKHHLLEKQIESLSNQLEQKEKMKNKFGQDIQETNQNYESKLEQQKKDISQQIQMIRDNYERQHQEYQYSIKRLEEEVNEYQMEKTRNLIQREQLIRKITMEKNDLITEKEMLQAQLDDITKKREQLKNENLKLKKQKSTQGKIGSSRHMTLKGKFEPYQNMFGAQEKSFLAFESNLPSFYIQKSNDKSSFMKNNVSKDDSGDKDLLDTLQQ